MLAPLAAQGNETASDSTWANRFEYVGIAVDEPGYHVWGSSPVIGPSGKTHLFVARWPVSSGFAGWMSTCEIARYVADKPEGPFQFSETVLKGTGIDTWDKQAPHNPTVHKVGNQYVLLYIANTGKKFPASQRIGMLIADKIEGPWKKVGNDGLILSPPDDPGIWSFQSNVGVNNPALLHHPDGRYFLYYKAMGNGLRRMGVAISDKLEGPYEHYKDYLTSNTRTIEDGYAFVEDGKIYLLTTDNEAGAGLLWGSDDGILFEKPILGFDRMTRYFPKPTLAKATNYRGQKFERPQLLVQDGRPTHLYLASGTNVTQGDGSCSYVFRIRQRTTADEPDASDSE
ncbi:glycoside hydrolase family protein [Rhodopirellula sp. ICT_H3.1]|uniref:Glycoside hydrolase family protein n=2 Tax=Aporhodopirellula aestuarii TaxID=2950107 RepID=A0ABT0U8G5_9BACT|nr:glycoside hydrolase family protein [Aporhodopirellula aestuarii]